MSQYVLVAPLARLEVGDGFSMSAWPLHVTIVPNFSTTLPKGDVSSVFSAPTPAMDVVVGREDLFGPRNNVRVSVVEHSEKLALLHARFVADLLGLGVVFDNPEYLGAGYRPHITATKRARAGEGDILHLDQLALVDMAPRGDSGHRVVVWVQSLG
jgi:hypothetical protein